MPVLKLPGVAALEAAVDQDASTVHPLVEVVGHLLALGADPVQTEVLDQRDLIRRVRARVTQEQVLGPSAAAEHEWLPVDQELTRALGRDRRGADQARRDRADPERLQL